MRITTIVSELPHKRPPPDKRLRFFVNANYKELRPVSEAILKINVKKTF